MKKTVIRDNSIIKNVDFTRLNEILKEKGIKKAGLSRRCGYNPAYVKDCVFGAKRLNWTVADTLEKEYGISQDEYCYEQTDTTASNDETAEGTKENATTFAFKIDPDTADIVRRYAFMKNMKVKDVMREIIIEELGDLKLPERKEEKILPEYLEGKKTATTISTDDTAETTISGNDTVETTASNDEPAEGTKQREKTVTFTFRTTPKTVYAIKGYAYYKNKSVRAVMEEMIAKELNGVDLPMREDEEKK